MTKPKAIQNLSKSTQGSINMLITAESGWGKTVFAGTADTRVGGGGKALFLVCDPEGTIAAASMDSTAEEWPIRDWDDLVAAYKWMRDEGCEEYDWVIIDSVTEAQKICMKKALEIAVKHKADRDPDVPAIQDYQKVQNQTLTMIKQFNDLPCNVIYTALPLRVEDDEGEVYYLPSLQGGQGALAQQVLGYMKVAGYGTFKTAKRGADEVTVRRIYFSPVGPYKGKDRFNVMGSHKDNLTVPQMEKLIRAGSKPAPAKRPVRKAVR